jgi:hypothetical protein
MLHAVIRSISTKYKAILPLFTTLYHIVNKFHHINPSPRKPDEKKLNTNHTSDCISLEFL